MTVRTTMSALISYVRLLIADPSGTSCTQFTDQQIQDVLDQHGTDVFQMRLTAADDIQTSGLIWWTDFYAQRPFWETGAKIQGNNWAVLTPTTSDEMNGKWTFTTSQSLPLWLSGTHYDVFAAATDLLRMWLSSVKLDFDFSSVNSGYQRSQKIRSIQQAIAQLQQRQPLRRIKMTRDDSGRWCR